MKEKTSSLLRNAHDVLVVLLILQRSAGLELQTKQ